MILILSIILALIQISVGVTLLSLPSDFWVIVGVSLIISAPILVYLINKKQIKWLIQILITKINK